MHEGFKRVDATVLLCFDLHISSSVHPVSTCYTEITFVCPFFQANEQIYQENRGGRDIFLLPAFCSSCRGISSGR